MEDFYFYYENYKHALFATAIIAVTVTGCFTNFWAVGVFVTLVKQPNIIEVFNHWKTANRKALKYFIFRKHKQNFASAPSNSLQSRSDS